MTLIVTLFSFFRPFAFSDSCVVKLYIKVPVQIVTVHHNLLIPIKIRNIYQDYTSFSLYYQIKLPLDLEISIPSDDPVRLVSAFVEEMDLSELYKTYGRIRKNQATPRQMLKLVIYAAMNRIYSSRDIRKACKRDINFRYLLEGMPAPDHATIARFISLHFSACAKALLAQMSDLLYLIGEISGKTIFIDGTKIESAANKYTFVWKKTVTKNQAKLLIKIADLIAECGQLYGIRIVHGDTVKMKHVKRLRKKLYALKQEENIAFVHGIGKRKTQLQKSIETLEDYLDRLKGYTKNCIFVEKGTVILKQIRMPSLCG